MWRHCHIHYARIRERDREIKVLQIIVGIADEPLTIGARHRKLQRGLYIPTATTSTMLDLPAAFITSAMYPCVCVRVRAYVCVFLCVFPCVRACVCVCLCACVLIHFTLMYTCSRFFPGRWQVCRTDLWNSHSRKDFSETHPRVFS